MVWNISKYKTQIHIKGRYSMHAKKIYIYIQLREKRKKKTFLL